MLASKNNYIKEASETMFQLSEDEQIRGRCLAREDYERDMRTIKKMLADNKACIAERDACIAEKNARIAEMSNEIQKLSAELEKLKADNEK